MAIGQRNNGRIGAQVSPIELRIDPTSGVPTYLQLVHQVDHALRLGYLKPGDQPPKVRDVDASLAINPNTVSKAFAELGSTSCRAQGSQIRQLHGHMIPDEGGQVFVPFERISESEGVANSFPSRNVLGILRHPIDTCGFVSRRHRLQPPRLRQRVRPSSRAWRIKHLLTFAPVIIVP
jgi:hypothetical protein